jgi:hypothetical protein
MQKSGCDPKSWAARPEFLDANDGDCSLHHNHSKSSQTSVGTGKRGHLGSSVQSDGERKMLVDEKSVVGHGALCFGERKCSSAYSAHRHHKEFPEQQSSKPPISSVTTKLKAVGFLIRCSGHREGLVGGMGVRQEGGEGGQTVSRTKQ